MNPTREQVIQWARESKFDLLHLKRDGEKHLMLDLCWPELERIVAIAYAAGQAAERDAALCQLVKELEAQRDDLLAEFNAYKEGSEEAFGTVVEQKQAAEARLQTMQLTIASQQGVICDFREQRDELLAVIKVIEINAEECMDFDECTAMLVPIDDYHRLIEVVESVKGNQV